MVNDGFTGLDKYCINPLIMYNTQKGDAIQNIFVDKTSTAPPPLTRGVTPNTALLAAARQSYKQSQLTATARAACCGLLARDTRDITRSRGHVSRVTQQQQQ